MGAFVHEVKMEEGGREGGREGERERKTHVNKYIVVERIMNCCCTCE